MVNSNLTIQSFEITGTNGVLIWSGGQAPYVVEQTDTPGTNWQAVAPSLNATQLVVPLTNQAGFFRVRTSGN